MRAALLFPRLVCSTAILGLSANLACQRSHGAPPGDTPAPSASPSVSVAVSASASASADPAASGPVHIEVALAGDAIPQVKVLANGITDVMANVPTCWTKADARVLNLEAPIGERKGLPGDKQILAYAAPVSWFADLYAASHASAFVVANNHSCDLGPPGLAQTIAEAEKISAPIAGASTTDPWKRVDIVEKGGRHVCVVAWTTFLNDEGKKGRNRRGCIDGLPASNNAKVARAELGKPGIDAIHAQLGTPGRWDGCDARIAFLHGGREYKPQIRPVLEQASAASAYVDAVIVSHPHVPDLAEVIKAEAPKNDAAAGGRLVGRGVPVFRSLGNFVSNQGIAWTSGMSVDLLEVEGVPDPIRTVWTRVAMIARLRFGWDATAPKGSKPSSVRYGYTLAFTDRSGPAMIEIRLRALPNGATDPIAARLRKAPKPFGQLLDAPCRVDAEAPLACDGLKGEGAPLHVADNDPDPSSASSAISATEHPVPDP